jgi:diguanylate cyclase (GGDEF)-like protein
VFVDEQAARAIQEVRQSIKSFYQLDEAEADAILNEINTKTREIAPLFEINLGQAIDLTSLLKKANEALVEITLQNQMQAVQLQQQNEQLKVKATTDRLTGLANRATFDEFLAEKFAEAKSANGSLSLLLMDVDKFKSVNDRHGHPAGDAVLKYLGQLLRDMVRETDLAARYGGEEMAIILPETNKSTAAAIAETIRRAIQAKPIPIGPTALPITASIGVASLEPGVPFLQPAHIVKAADLAVYKAKHSGRNNVKVFSFPPQQAKPAA